MNEEHNEIKKLQIQKARENRSQVQNLFLANGGMYMAENGEAKFKEDTENLRGNVMLWNVNTGMAIGWNLHTINIMIFTLSQINLLSNDVQYREKHRLLYMHLCAIRKQMIEEQAKTIATNNPDFSTPPNA